jgi:Zn-dependent protease
VKSKKKSGVNMFNNLSLTTMLLTIPGVLIGFVFHEFAHAYTSDILGDPTPRSQGKLSFDPRVHIDLIGFILIIIVGFGWAKPVQTNPKYYRNPRRDRIIVSFAGPFMNLVLAIIFAILLKILFVLNPNFYNDSSPNMLISLFVQTIYMNILLFVLNLIPIPFFDGYSILSNLVNLWRYRIFGYMEQYNLIIFMILAITGIFSRILTPPIEFIFSIMLRVLQI